jgi:aldehyde:ferredoxin oxidoreductase
MPNGYTGKILRVNLTNSTVSEVDTFKYVPKYIGGRGVALRIYWEEVEPEVQPLDPENKLIFMTGPLNGTIATGHSGRLSLVSKAPQTFPTHSVADSNAGGFFAPELKYAGWDGIIVEGKAAKPVYIYIDNGKVSILDAGSLWGLTTYAAQTEIWRRHGWKTRQLVIGPAGENLSRISVILTDIDKGFGQGGFGAVMGSKNLKIIAVRGTGSVEVAKPDELMAVVKKQIDRTSVHYGKTAENGYGGTPWPMNFRASKLETAPAVQEGAIEVGYAGCHTCNIQCRQTVKFNDGSIAPSAGQCADSGIGNALLSSPYTRGQNFIQPTYVETLKWQELGLNIWDMCAMMVIPAGMGSLGVPPVIASLIMEGILTNENTGWPIDKYGFFPNINMEFMQATVNDIAYGRGFGVIAGMGAQAMCEYIAEHEEFGPNRAKALQIARAIYPLAGNFKGYQCHHNTCLMGGPQEYSEYLYWLVSNRDPYTKHTGNSFYQGGSAMLAAQESEEWLNILKPVMKKYIGTDKPIASPGFEDAEKAARWWWQMNLETDCLPLCDFWGVYRRFWSVYSEDGIGVPEAGAELYNAVTGESLTQKELWERCEVPWMLERAIACREGRRASDDEYTDEFIAVAKDYKGRYVENEKIRELKPKFYNLLGWNENGIPTRAKLEQIGLKDVADDLENRGVL